MNRPFKNLDSLSEALSASIAGACATAILYPLDVLLVRYQAARRLPPQHVDDSDAVIGVPRAGAPVPGILDVINSTLQEKGEVLRAMYHGVEFKLVEVSVRNFVYFFWSV